jgi:hypothetical protein
MHRKVEEGGTGFCAAICTGNRAGKGYWNCSKLITPEDRNTRQEVSLGCFTAKDMLKILTVWGGYHWTPNQKKNNNGAQVLAWVDKK